MMTTGSIRSPRRAAGLAWMALVLAFTAPDAHAGAWVKQPGETYAKLSGGAFFSDGIFDINGTLVPDPALEYGNAAAYAYLEDIIRAELGALFPGQKVVSAAAFRISRDAEMELDDEGGGNYLENLEGELRKRRQARVVRLEVEDGVSEALLAVLQERLGAAPDDVYRVKGPLDIRALFPLVELPALEDLRDAPLKPLPTLDEREQQDLFAPVRIADYMLDKDRLFARIVLDDEEFKLYDQVYARLAMDAPTPDLVVFLQAPVDILLQRIDKRGIAYEKYIDAAYLERLGDAYTRYFHQYTASPLLIVNTAEIDPANNSRDFDDLYETIRQTTSGRHYVNPVRR